MTESWLAALQGLWCSQGSPVQAAGCTGLLWKSCQLRRWESKFSVSIDTFHEPTDYHRFLLHRDVQCRIVVMVASKPSLGSGCCCWWWCCCCCCWNQAIPFLPASDTATNAFLLSSSTKCRGRTSQKSPSWEQVSKIWRDVWFCTLQSNSPLHKKLTSRIIQMHHHSLWVKSARENGLDSMICSSRRTYLSRIFK